MEEYDPLIIHVEGGTTNGQYLVEFKKGAFVGEKSIWPKANRYNSWF
jgi:hypothetical protein